MSDDDDKFETLLLAKQQEIRRFRERARQDKCLSHDGIDAALSQLQIMVASINAQMTQVH